MGVETILLGSALAGAGAFGARERKKRKEEKAEANIQRSRDIFKRQQALQEQKQKTEIAQESVRRQKEKARKRTIFAGADMRQNIFKKTLGS